MEAPRRARLRDRHIGWTDTWLIVAIMTMGTLSAWGGQLIVTLVQIVCAIVVLVVGFGTSEV